MKKYVILTMVLTVFLYCFGLLKDMHLLHSDVIRLHVVGASDSKEDQSVKLMVKDAINGYLGTVLQDAVSVSQARLILEDEMPNIQKLSEAVLRSNGFQESVVVTLEKEEFPRREYDTFTLPSGVYDSLRIRIGSAEGKNWWCVVFPSLCIPAAGDGLQDVAAGAGFSDELTNTLTGEEGYELRFFLLDWLGQLQNLWFDK